MNTTAKDGCNIFQASDTLTKWHSIVFCFSMPLEQFVQLIWLGAQLAQRKSGTPTSRELFSSSRLVAL